MFLALLLFIKMIFEVLRFSLILESYNFSFFFSFSGFTPSQGFDQYKNFLCSISFLVITRTIRHKVFGGQGRNWVGLDSGCSLLGIVGFLLGNGTTAVGDGIPQSNCNSWSCGNNALANSNLSCYVCISNKLIMLNPVRVPGVLQWRVNWIRVVSTCLT